MDDGEDSDREPDLNVGETVENVDGKDTLKFIIPDEKGFFRFLSDDMEGVDEAVLLRKLEGSGSKTVCIGLFGKSFYASGSDNASAIFDNLVQRGVFGSPHRQALDVDQPYIEGYHDDRNCRLYLHLVGGFDSYHFVEKVLRKKSNFDHLDIHSFFRDQKLINAKLLLFMFNVCHIMICHHANHALDSSYTKLFQVLDQVRGRLHFGLGEYVRSVDLKTTLPKDVSNHGRFCVPRLLFYFSSCPRELRGSRGRSDLLKRDGTVSKHPPIRKLEFSLEDQLFRVYRRVKLASSTSSPNSLFLLPSSREGYVYVNNDREEEDPMMSQMENLYRTLESSESQQRQTDSDEIDDDDDGDDDDDDEIVPHFYDQGISEYQSKSRNFAKFLTSHIELVKKKAESDKSSEQLPTPAQWFLSASVLFPIYGSTTAKLGESDKPTSSSSGFVRANGLLSNYASIASRFSENRCLKALPMALNTYKDGLQPHYLSDYHNTKLLQAMTVFSVQARGPASAKYAEVLVNDCNNYWQSGRQMCEELSLTGHHCTNRKHLIHGQQHPKDCEGQEGVLVKKNLPIMPHQSSVTFVAACNCGRRQSNREDPFTLNDANHSFYSGMEEECCGDLEHIEVPFFKQQRTSSANFALLSSPSIKDLKLTAAGSENVAATDKDEKSTVKAVASANQVFEAESGKEKLESLAASSTPSLKRQNSSNSDLLPHMLTRGSAAGKLPEFPSWTLIQLGSASVYAHSSGVSQPGFLSNTKNLLPWDVPLKNTDWSALQTKWPNLVEIALKKPSFNPNAKGFDMGITVKVFVGLEYECPRGHRFISSSPGKTKSMSSSLTGRLINSDAPLYLACPCKQFGAGSSNARPFVAQLMRIHVVTPKAPINVMVDPKVVPCPDGPSFHPGWTDPVKLPSSSYWILRLPFIYWGHGGSHLPPKDVPDVDYAKLLKGFISCNED